MRSKYFDAALKTGVGNAKSKSEMDVEDCSPEVLTCAVDFMYGIPIPKDFADTQGLLHQADLFMMEDLKTAAGSLIAKTLSQNFEAVVAGEGEMPDQDIEQGARCMYRLRHVDEEVVDDVEEEFSHDCDEDLEFVDVDKKEPDQEMDQTTVKVVNQEVLISGKAERNKNGNRVMGKKKVYPNEKPFICEISGCGKKFALKTGLMAHIGAVHNKERSHVCPAEGCGKSFGWKGSLKGHIRIVHMQTKPFVCDKLGCSRKYGLESDLKRHIRNIHNREKPHICPEAECGKKFGLRASLQKHKKSVHQKERPFQCEIPGCAKTFGFKSSLNVHIRIVHNKEMPYECKEEGCGKKFQKKRILNLHINKVHLEMKPFSVPMSPAVKEEA